MSDIHVISEVRARFKAVIAAANISIDIGGTDTPVTCLDQIPAGYSIKSESLPALYSLMSGETVGESDLTTEPRDIFFDIATMATAQGDPLDQLDPMQLKIEAAFAASGNLGGLAYRLRYLGAEVAQHQGAMVLGVRILKYRVSINITVGDPSL